jgi:hypothetical protein
VGSNTPLHRRRPDGRCKCAMKILIAHEFVMGWRMMFGKIIGSVGSPGGPVEVKLLLSIAIFKPVVTHVKSFRLFHADLSMENAVSSGIVSLKRSSRMWMAHFYESSAYGNCLLGIEKEAAGFSFRGRGSNGVYSFAKNMDGTVELRIWR